MHKDEQEEGHNLLTRLPYWHSTEVQAGSFIDSGLSTKPI